MLTTADARIEEQRRLKLVEENDPPEMSAELALQVEQKKVGGGSRGTLLEFGGCRDLSVRGPFYRLHIRQ